MKPSDLPEERLSELHAALGLELDKRDVIEGEPTSVATCRAIETTILDHADEITVLDIVRVIGNQTRRSPVIGEEEWQDIRTDAAERRQSRDGV